MKVPTTGQHVLYMAHQRRLWERRPPLAGKRTEQYALPQPATAACGNAGRNAQIRPLRVPATGCGDINHAVRVPATGQPAILGSCHGRLANLGFCCSMQYVFPQPAFMNMKETSHPCIHYAYPQAAKRQIEVS